MKRLLIENIGTLATPEGNSARGGELQGKVKTLHNAYIYIEDGIIKAVGEGEANIDKLSAGAAGGKADALGGKSAPSKGKLVGDNEDDISILDAEGMLVTPGLVDAHTHLVFGGWRQNELEKKLKGLSYLTILAEGGGILSTVKATRGAASEELVEKAEGILDEMFDLGVTTLEAKSGYGLDRENELKQLEAIKTLKKKTPIELVSTFMGAHAVPKEYKEKGGIGREEYIDFLIDELIPEVAKKKLAEFCDVFCEKDVFSREDSMRILDAAKKHGLTPKIHTDEIVDIGGTMVAEETGAISAEHLIKCSNEGIKRLKRAGAIACLLPCTSFYLGVEYARARDMINEGVPVAMATDFNPGSCPVSNIQLVMNVGCLNYRMMPEEVLTAVTLNGAAALGRADRIGSIEVGKQADIVIWEAPDLAYLCYRMGSNPVSKVVKKGIVYE